MAGAQEPSVIARIENGIQKVFLNRPGKKNAINRQMYRELTRLLAESAINEEVTLFAITGNGDFYSSGNDFISYVMEETLGVDDETEILSKFVEQLIYYPKLLVAIVNGPAIGIMCTTLALFDIIYASEKTYFLTPFCKLGLSPEGCSSYTFPRIMGPSKAGEMLFFGEKLNAQEAARIGFVSKVYKSDAVKEIWAHLDRISTLSKESLISTKSLLSRWNRDMLLKVNEQELSNLKNFYNSPTLIENMMKLMAKKSKI
ncbi:enoyl-CoA delta isomerase 2, mitochondrial [Copidosoma floridanum]|uniref:enoyl-CoA delta isomerase 2, mitochondrial n=1 Tax=Copidosoma floridanum TaxID=29053 RepID=UPI0006C9E2EF|nr:enoyl-CoA delta isomerase 2, mitochondrial [Copidosoma floridanum]